MTDLPLDPPTTFGDDRSTEQLAAAVYTAMWRQQTGDAIAARLRLLSDEVAVTRAALIPITALDREVLGAALVYLADALSAVEAAVHELDTWQQGDRP